MSTFQGCEEIYKNISSRPARVKSFHCLDTLDPVDQTSPIDKFFGDGLERNDKVSLKGNLGKQGLCGGKIILKSLPELVWIICAGVFCSEDPGLDKHYYHKQQHPAPDQNHYGRSWRIRSISLCLVFP